MKKSIQEHSLVILIILVFIWVKLQFIHLPLHNDELNHMEGVWLTVKNDFVPFVEWWSYHPPLIYETVALGTLLFSNWAQLAKAIIAMFGALTLFATYKLGSQLYNKKTGIIAAVLLFFLPIFQSQSSLFHLAIPLTFFFLVAFYFYLKENWRKYVLFSSLLVLTKEIGAVIIFLLSLYDIFLNRKKGFKNILRRTIIINLSQLTFLGWMITNKIKLGWYLYPFSVSFFSEDKSYQGVESLNQLLKTNFLDTGAWVLTAGLLLGAIAAVWQKGIRKIFLKRESIFAIFMAVFFCIFFYIGAYLPRYTLFTLPMLTIIVAVFLNGVINQNRLLGSSLLLSIVVVLVLNWFRIPNQTIPWAGEKNFAFINIVRNHQRTVQWVNQHYPFSKVLTHYPLNSALAWPPAGYIQGITDLDVEVFNPKLLDSYKGLVIISSFLASKIDQQEIDQVENMKTTKLIKIIKNPGVETRIFEVQ